MDTFEYNSFIVNATNTGEGLEFTIALVSDEGVRLDITGPTPEAVVESALARIAADPTTVYAGDPNGGYSYASVDGYPLVFWYGRKHTNRLYGMLYDELHPGEWCAVANAPANGYANLDELKRGLLRAYAKQRDTLEFKGAHGLL